MKMLIGKLNPTCKKALEGAAALCVTKGQYNIELEHFLVKLLEPMDSDLQIILRYYEIDLQTVLKQLMSTIDKMKTGNTTSPVLSKHILSVLEQAWLISSLRLGQGAIRSGSILHALIDADPLRGIILESCPLLLRIPRLNFEKDIDDLLKASKEDFGSSSETSEFVKEIPQSMSSGTSFSSALKDYTENLTLAAQTGKLDPIFGRETEIRQVIDVLSRRFQNNPILVGEAGVGKTAIVEGLAQRICQKDVPQSLQDVQIHKLDLSLLQAGASAKGQFEERLNQLLQEIKDSPYPIVLFVDEAHTLMGAGGTQGLGDAANLLKPSLARGELRTIAATTWSEYKRHFEKDAALVRRFEKVKVKEPTPEQTISMLRLVAEKYQHHHNVPILSEAIEAASKLSHRFLPERRLPDKAISVLDTACAQVALSQSGKPEELQICLSQIGLLDIELKMLRDEELQVLPSSLKNSSPVQRRVDDVKDELGVLHSHHQALLREWEKQKSVIKKIESLRQQIKGLGSPEIASSEIMALQREIVDLQKTVADLSPEQILVRQAVDQAAVAHVISNWTGIPLRTILAQGNGMSLDYLLNALKTKIFGQEEALSVLSQSIVNYHIGLADTNKPIGIFMLAGPSGVGKTETALALAEILTGNSRHLVKLNMGEFQESHSIAILKGAPPGYVGHGKGGTLTEAVRQNPYSVVLIDEIDKAHDDVINLFAQIFDKGILEDSDGVEVDFSNTLFVLTTNQGAEIIQSRYQDLKETDDKTILFHQLTVKVTDELTKTFGTPFIARTIIVPYLPLGIADIENIVRHKLRKIEDRLREKHKFELSHSDDFVTKIAEDFIGHKRGIRAIEMYLSQNVIPKLAEAALNQDTTTGDDRKIHLG